MICTSQGFGVYRFAKKYGANVDGYSPIYTPDLWSESGNSYKAGTKGLIAWCAPCSPCKIQTLQQPWMLHLLLMRPCWTLDVLQSYRLLLADVLLCCTSAGLVWW